LADFFVQIDPWSFPERRVSVTPSASQLPSMTNRQIKDVVPKAWSSARKKAFQKFGTVCSNPLFEKGPLDRRESVCLAAISRR